MIQIPTLRCLVLIGKSRTRPSYILREEYYHLNSEIKVVAPIDPLQGKIYDKPVHSEGQGDYIDHIYNITYVGDDYINPTTGGNMGWWRVSSCTSDLGEALDN